MVSYKWSHYSTALFDTFQSTTDNIIVQACPGSGKTTNIQELCSIAPLNEETVYLAFNKAIVEEARSKLPQHINIMTLNGLGHRAVMAAYGKVTLDDRKVYKIIRERVPLSMYPRQERDDVISSLQKAVALLKMQVTTPSKEDFSSLLSTYDIDEFPDMYHESLSVLQHSDDMVNTIDFNDQLRFPVVKGLSMPSYDNIMGDEVQDFSPIQASMIEKLQGRYVLVGDRHQSIYGFRGAMNDSMDYLKGMFQCTELPLSLTYRCPRSVVQEAFNIYPDIEAPDDAPLGIVRYSDRVEEYKPDALILCRNNKPLVSMAYKLLERGIACHVRGRDIGQGLVALVKKLGSSTVKDLVNDLEAYRETEVYKAQKRGDEAKIQRINDKVDSLLIFTTRCGLGESTTCVMTAIDSLFNQGRGICLSTVHKAKGLEASDVYVLDRGLMPAVYARQDWQRIQERNIEYVAVTRSKSQLVYM